jgi:hypothetical protein
MAGKKPAEGVELDVPSPHQQYLESLLGEEHEAPTFGGVSVNPNDNKAITDDGYVGVDPVYQNFANDTDEPLQADEGGDKLAEDAYVEAVEGDAKEAGEELKELFGAVTNADENDGQTIGGDPVHATVTPVAPEDNDNAGVTSGATGAPNN